MEKETHHMEFSAVSVLFTSLLHLTQGNTTLERFQIKYLVQLRSSRSCFVSSFNEHHGEHTPQSEALLATAPVCSLEEGKGE